ncbi:MaoC/PaaZ C-terminal domain-containing protein [Demequina sp. SYSU T00039]|uniref:MaoC/PaaZ C-terminal domain-containing protein n=1 Tax=Demequina lignilytica TaxID=3051663 RepID=A0AAW7M6I1_9MICO|nr:MaoC/PaaZ C-terminal domain-containing protein [Demequina sp. SYSU T00039]MDN4486633.1 MaoC/PaaZ C-terminal domain-containing protein [Demequina sp. SYSU T00039]
MAVEVLSEAPGMGAAFARAMVPARARGARLPEDPVRLEGYRQDAARLADYARVCGFPLRDTVPPTWLHVLTFPLHVHLLGDRRSSVRLVGAVHVSNSMTLRRPVSVREELAIEVAARGLRPHQRGALLDLVGTIRVAGETVWEGVSTYLASGMEVPGEPVELPREPFTAVVPHARWRLPAGLGRDYRRVSGDPNPIHTSRLAARAFGFPRPIIHGMWTHARALAALDGRLPEAYRTDVAFTKPVLLPGSVGFHAALADGVHSVAVTSRDGAKPHLLMSVSSTERARA